MTHKNIRAHKAACIGNMRQSIKYGDLPEDSHIIFDMPRASLTDEEKRQKMEDETLSSSTWLELNRKIHNNYAAVEKDIKAGKYMTLKELEVDMKQTQEDNRVIKKKLEELAECLKELEKQKNGDDLPPLLELTPKLNPIPSGERMTARQYIMKNVKRVDPRPTLTDEEKRLKMEDDDRQYEHTHRIIKEQIAKAMRDIDSGSEGEEPDTDDHLPCSRLDMIPTMKPIPSGERMTGRSYLIANVTWSDLSPPDGTTEMTKEAFSVDRNMKDMLLIYEEMQAKWKPFEEETKGMKLASEASYEENMKEFHRLCDEMPELVRDDDGPTSYGTPIYDDGGRVIGRTLPSCDSDID